MFTNKSRSGTTEVIHLGTLLGNPLAVSIWDFIFEDGGLKAAAKIRDGDTLILETGAVSPVSSIYRQVHTTRKQFDGILLWKACLPRRT
jgi:hypothetical protein